MKKHTQKGFAHLGILLLVLVVAVVALAGYKVYKNGQNTVTNSSVTAAGQAIQPIKSAADLNTAQNTLNNTNLDGDLNPDALNQDVNSLL